MKRILCGLAISAILLTSMAALAEPAQNNDNTLTSPGQSLQKPVTAVYEQPEDANLYSDELENGSASVTTGDGTVVTVTVPEGALPAGTVMFVRQISPDEEDAYEWITGTVEGQGTGALPFYIYFENDSQRVEPDGSVQISITLTGTFTNPKLFAVNLDGEATGLEFDITNNTLTFTMSAAGYFVLLSGTGSPSEPGSSEPPASSSPGAASSKPTDGPKTGDTTAAVLFLGLISLGVTIAIAKRRNSVSA